MIGSEIQVLEQSNQKLVTFNLQSKLLQEKIIMIAGEIDEESVLEYQEQLLYLLSKCNEGDVIQIYINSVGGEVYSGLGLYDVIQIIKSKGIIVKTINVGQSFSMAAFILMSGTEGYRCGTKNSTTMIHEVSSGFYGKSPEILDHSEEIRRVQKIAHDIITKHADSKLIELSERKDLWLSSEDALKYKIIDKIIE